MHLSCWLIRCHVKLPWWKLIMVMGSHQEYIFKVISRKYFFSWSNEWFWIDMVISESALTVNHIYCQSRHHLFMVSNNLLSKLSNIISQSKTYLSVFAFDSLVSWDTEVLWHTEIQQRPNAAGCGIDELKVTIWCSCRCTRCYMASGNTCCRRMNILFWS